MSMESSNVVSYVCEQVTRENTVKLLCLVHPTAIITGHAWLALVSVTRDTLACLVNLQ